MSRRRRKSTAVGGRVERGHTLRADRGPRSRYCQVLEMSLKRCAFVIFDWGFLNGGVRIEGGAEGLDGDGRRRTAVGGYDAASVEQWKSERRVITVLNRVLANGGVRIER